MDNLEYCFKCDEPTGCAGRADDSHYNEDGEGPFCWRCWCEDENPRLNVLIDRQQADLAAARGQIKMGKRVYQRKERTFDKGLNLSNLLATENNQLNSALAAKDKRIAELEQIYLGQIRVIARSRLTYKEKVNRMVELAEQA